MKSKKTYQKELDFIKQTISLLLLCTIFTITLVQSFHHHHPTSQKTTIYKTSLTKNTVNCAVCEFLLHQKSNEYLISKQISLAYIQPTANVIKGTIHSGIFPKAIVAFTNKGPPTTV